MALMNHPDFYRCSTPGGERAEITWFHAGVVPALAMCSTPGGERAEITTTGEETQAMTNTCSTPGGERAEITAVDCGGWSRRMTSAQRPEARELRSRLPGCCD